MIHWTYGLYKISLSLSLFFFLEKIISSGHSCVVTGCRSHFVVWVFCEPSWAILIYKKRNLGDIYWQFL